MIELVSDYVNHSRRVGKAKRSLPTAAEPWRAGARNSRFQSTESALTVRLHELFEPERSIGGTELCCPAIPVFRLGRVGLEIDDA